MERITLAIAYHDSSGTATCRTMLSLDHDITVITRITGGKDLVSRMLRLKPRVLLFSVGLCTDAECSVLQALRHACPDTIVVLLADHSIQEDRLANALAVGARGYLEQGDIERLLANVVHRVAGGEAWVPRKILGKIMTMAFP